MGYGSRLRSWLAGNVRVWLGMPGSGIVLKCGARHPLNTLPQQLVSCSAARCASWRWMRPTACWTWASSPRSGGEAALFCREGAALLSGVGQLPRMPHLWPAVLSSGGVPPAELLSFSPSLAGLWTRRTCRAPASARRSSSPPPSPRRSSALPPTSCTTTSSSRWAGCSFCV